MDVLNARRCANTLGWPAKHNDQSSGSQRKRLSAAAFLFRHACIKWIQLANKTIDMIAGAQVAHSAARYLPANWSLQRR